jgi:hypothetical protein
MRTLVLFVVLILSPVLAHAADLSKVRASSVVLLAEPRLPPPGVVRERLEQRLKGRLKVDAMEADGAKVVLFRLRGGTVAIGLIESPLPKGQIDDLCAGAWHWKAACEATASHRGHVFITVLDTDLDTLDASLLLTDVVAALMDSNAIASYWGASLQSRDAFLKQSADVGREQPPVWLWVNFRISNDIEKGFSLSTQGMEAFGLREIEAKDVFSLLLGMAQYLIQKGPVIKDGETIGASPALNIRVRQGPSYWREGATVYRVTYPRD